MAELIVLTPRGQARVAAGIATIQGIETRLDEVLGARGHAELRRLLGLVLSAS